MHDIYCAQIPEVSLKGTVTDENSHSVTQWCGRVAVQQVVWRIISRLFCTHHRMLYVFSSGSHCQLMKYHLCWCACTTDMEIHISGSDEDVDAFGRNEVSLQSEHLGHIRAIESRTSGDITVIQLTYFIGIDDRISGHIHKLEMNSCYRNLVPVVYDCTHKPFQLLIIITLVTHICANMLGYQWFRSWLFSTNSVTKPSITSWKLD